MGRVRAPRRPLPGALLRQGAAAQSHAAACNSEPLCAISLTPHAPPQAESFAIKFVRAQADNIGMLKEYKDQSKPVFLLFLDKTEKEKIEGPNLPELRKQISALAPPAVE